jgi:ArsR family transcriptional regulator
MNIVISELTVYKQQTALFKALAHPVRLRILDLLAQEEACVCHLTAALGRRQPYVSQQLMVLREAELVTDRKDGLMVYYRLRDDGVRDLVVAGRAALDLPAPALPPRPMPGCTCPHCCPAP